MASDLSRLPTRFTVRFENLPGELASPDIVLLLRFFGKEPGYGAVLKFGNLNLRRSLDFVRIRLGLCNSPYLKRLVYPADGSGNFLNERVCGFRQIAKVD